MLGRPGPWPVPTGTRPRRSGRAEVVLPVPARGGPQQRKKSRILGDAQDLSLAESPAARGKISRKQDDLGKEWCCHIIFSFYPKIASYRMRPSSGPSGTRKIS